MEFKVESFEVLNENVGVPIKENMLSSCSFKGSDHVGNESALYEKLILDLDSFWDELNDRLSVSRMVSDLVIKGMVNAIVEEAAEKIALKEEEITISNGKLQSCKSNVAMGQNLELVMMLQKSLMMEAKVDERQLESRKSCLSASGDCNYADNVGRLRIMVENQIQWLKKDLQHLKSLDMVSRQDMDPCNILHEAKTIQKLLEIDGTVDALKDILAVGFEQISSIICSKKAVSSELQWEHELQREVNTIVLQDYVRCLQDEYETKLYHQTIFIKTSNNNWQKKASELNAMRDELHAISEEVNNHENFEEWSVAKRKEHFPVKVLGNHNFPSQPEENGTMMMEKSGDSGEDMLDIAHLPHLKHMTKEELLAYYKTEMTKMRRRHELELQEKTEDLFKFKRDFLKEKGSSPFRKDKELEHLRKKVLEFVLKLDEILMEKEILPQIYDHDDESRSFKERIYSLFSENRHLQGLLMKKTNELKCLSAQISDAVSQMSLHSSVEANYLKQLRSLENDIEDVKIEGCFRDELCNTILRGLIDEHRSAMQHTEIEIKSLLEIYTTIFRGVIGDAISSINPAISKYFEEKMSLEALLLEKDNALRSEIEANHKLKQVVASISSSMIEKEMLNMSLEALLLEKENTLRSEIEENCKLKQVVAAISSSLKEKEKLASEAESALTQQKQQLDVVHQECNMLRDRLNMQEVQLSDYKMDSNSLRSRLYETVQQIHHYELEMDKLNEKLKIASDALKEAEKQKTKLLGDIEDKQRMLSLSFEKDQEQVTQLGSITKFMMELSKSFADLESHLIENTKINESRLKVLCYQLNPLVQLTSQQKKKCLWYKNMLEIRCSDLQKAEAEVDLLGDEVEVLVGLLGKIYLALDHYSPVLQHYPGVMEILKLVQRELNGENN